MDTLFALTVLKAVHVISASIWIGSIVSLSLAVRVVRSIVGSPHSATISAEIGRRLRPLTRTSLYLTVASGVLLAFERGFLSGLISLDLQYRPVFVVFLKVLLGASLLLTVWYHSYLGGSLIRNGDAIGLLNARKRMIVVGWLTVALSIVLAVLGTVLRFG